MKKIILIICILFNMKAFADFQISPGLNFTLPFQSNETNSLNVPYFKGEAGLGIDFNFQINFPWSLSLNLGGTYQSGNARSQYSFFDSQTSTTTTVTDLDTTYNIVNTDVSLRFHFWDHEHVKLYAGLGAMLGILYLNYQQSDFENKHSNNTTGLNAKESLSFSNPFWETGCEYFWNKQDGLQLNGKFYKIKTGRFSTLNSTGISSSVSQISLLYNHVISWDFIWK